MKRENVIALSGGVVGAKLADGLVQAVAEGRLTVGVNTASDFNHRCLRRCHQGQPGHYQQ